MVWATREPVESQNARCLDSYHIPKGGDSYKYFDIEFLKDGNFVPYFGTSTWGSPGTIPVSVVNVTQDIVTQAIHRTRGRDAALSDPSEVVKPRAVMQDPGELQSPRMSRFVSPEACRAFTEDEILVIQNNIRSSGEASSSSAGRGDAGGRNAGLGGYTM